MLAGYGLLVLVGVLPHDAPLAGAVSLLAGIAVLAWRRLGLPAIAPRAGLVAFVGSACVGGILGYAAARRNGLGGPELAILAYGLLLMAASLALDRHLSLGGAGRRRVAVSTLVGWSFPLVLAPLGLFALNASLSSGAAGTAAAPIVERLVVGPTAAALRLFGTPVDQVGSTLMLTTPRGSLSLGVGLVCAGLYPSVLFGGLVALHAWQHRLRPAAVAGILAAGLAGLWLLNVVRLVLLTKIGIRWGMDALQTAHANLGWVFFSAFMALFWWLVLRRAPASPAPTRVTDAPAAATAHAAPPR